MRDFVRIAVVCVLGLGTSLGAWASAEEPERAATPVIAEASPRVFAAQVDAGGRKEVEIPAEVMVLHATNSGGGIDEELRHLKQLQKPPFSSYNTYRLIDSHPFTLTAKRSKQTTRLPNGRDLRTELKEILRDRRYRVAASISRPKKGGEKEDSYLPLLEVTTQSGETFFVAGQSYRGGILVVGIRVGREDKKPPRE